MCYAIPGQVLAIRDDRAVISYFGEERSAMHGGMLLAVGDYVYAQGGFIIERLDREDAQLVLDTWRELFFHLQDVDRRLSSPRVPGSDADKKYLRILDTAMEGRALSRDEYVRLLMSIDERECDLLYRAANFLRQKRQGNSCCVHGIIEYSNYCDELCRYCGISSHNSGLARYRMTENEIVDEAVMMIRCSGFRSLVLQGGEDPAFDTATLCRIVERIRAQANALLIISAGEIGIESLKRLYTSGVRGLLMRFETSIPELYERLHPGSTLNERLLHITAASEMGYLVVTGSLVGLPGQTPENILDDILLAKSLSPEMVSIGPFIPHPRTPLGALPPSSVQEVMNAIAVTRIVDPDNAKILVTTALETLDANIRRCALMAGANSIMLNLTPQGYRERYDIYPSRAHVHDDVKLQIDDAIGLLREIGRSSTDLSMNERTNTVQR